ncbi:hypothetical protein V6Z11_A02G133500 [Gossypium hirsutum]
MKNLTKLKRKKNETNQSSSLDLDLVSVQGASLESVLHRLCILHALKVDKSVSSHRVLVTLSSVSNLWNNSIRSESIISPDGFLTHKQFDSVADSSDSFLSLCRFIDSPIVALRIC